MFLVRCGVAFVAYMPICVKIIVFGSGRFYFIICRLINEVILISIKFFLFFFLLVGEYISLICANEAQGVVE